MKDLKKQRELFDEREKKKQFHILSSPDTKRIVFDFQTAASRISVDAFFQTGEMREDNEISCYLRAKHRGTTRVIVFAN